MSKQRHENLEQELRELHSEVPLPPGGLVAGREKMLAEAVRLDTQVAGQALSTVEAERSLVPTRRRKMNLLLAYKVLAAVMAVVVAVVGMGGGVVLAADSLPGEFLYPVKLWSEDVILAVTPDAARRAEFGMAFVAERVEEMARLAQQGEDVPEAVVARMTRQMEQVMVQIAQARPEEAPALLERVMERARIHQQVLAASAAETAEETQTKLRLASEVMERTREKAENDPRYLEYQNQHQYEGAPGPHREASPAPSGEAQQTQEQEQQQRHEGTPGPHGEASPEPAGDPQRNQEEQQQRHEGTPGPHGQGSSTPTETVSPGTGDPGGPATEPERTREEEQYRHEGTPGPHGEEPAPPSDSPRSTPTPKQGSGPGNGR